MKTMRRALRRHHRQRLLARARRVFRLHDIGAFYPSLQQWTCRTYNNLQHCSCPWCGHRRKWHGITIQERRHNESIRYGDR